MIYGFIIRDRINVKGGSQPTLDLNFVGDPQEEKFWYSLWEKWMDEQSPNMDAFECAYRFFQHHKWTMGGDTSFWKEIKPTKK